MAEKKPIQPFYLPQVSAPYSFIKNNLEEFGVFCRPVIVSVGQLKPLQKEVDLIKVTDISEVDEENLDPIWISNNDKILDGHHRTSSKKFKNGAKDKIRAIRIDADDKDGCALLKVIQDRWERQQKGN